ncbi:cytochrome P450 [Xylona heveae TC161]|uniref:Cytochrome P450 n=1 Tax=Xylona heveae (strain CBS 132557 / TC161) TaxID=1328760 RepID=A0A165A0Q0_XYLHT|nr:cytochrome P450 [Xylona heveae TC161]KZF19789.1 cytochrome P450 [Xylona heveae TC161]
MSYLVDTVLNLALSAVVLVLSTFLWNYLRSPLKSFPGPAPASFTNIWRLVDVFKGRCDITQNDLHKKLGPAVRMGPNVLSLSDPSMVGKVFTTRNPWKKSNMYMINDVMVNGVRVSNLFSTRSEEWHSTSIRPIKSLYSMTKVQDFEHHVDTTLNFLMQKLEERFINTGKPCDMADYLLYFAWDAMSQITFGKNLGILEAGNDDRKFLHTSSRSLDYFASVSQMPELDRVLDKNPVKRLGPPTFGWAIGFSVDAYTKRMAEGPPATTDFLEKFIETKKKHPDIVDDNMVVTYLLSNVLAGSDTTAITMCSAMYNILKNPKVHQRLNEELKKANVTVPVSWKATQEIPYLDAIMREAMRIHPGVGVMMERIVPEEGLQLPDGRFVPGGAAIGMNPWVITRDEDVFGSDTDMFIPERWLQQAGETDEDFEARRNKMKVADFVFGAGPRMCLGRYLSQLESYKLIATMFAQYDIELESPDTEWKIINSWFVRQENIPVIIKEKVGA